MKSYTPTKAHNLLLEFFEIFPDMGRAVIRGADLEEFNATIEAAEAVSKAQPTTTTCRELEQHVGVMVNFLLDAPLLKTKPQDQVQLLVDGIEIVGTALSIAAGTWKATDIGMLH
jgi:hypothetical protein